MREDVLGGLLQVARIQQMVGDSAESVQHARRALALAQVIYREQPESFAARRVLGRARQLLAISLSLQDQANAAIGLFEDNVIETRLLSAEYPKDRELFKRNISVHCALAREYFKSGDQDRALKTAAEALELCRIQTETQEPNHPLTRSESQVLDLRSQIHLFGKKHQLARHDAQAALDLLIPYGTDSEDSDLRTELAERYHSLARVQGIQGDVESCNKNFEQAIAISKATAARHPDHVSIRANLATFHAQYAQALQSQKQYRQAVEQLEESIAIQELLLELDPTRTNHKIALSQSLLQLGTIRLITRKFTEALPPMRRSVALRRELVKSDTDTLRHHGHLGHALINLAQYEYRLGDKQLATKLIEESVRSLRTAVEALPDFASFRRSFQAALLWAARLRIAAGDHAAAVEALAEAVDKANLQRARLRSDKVFAPLRDRPDFKALCKD